MERRLAVFEVERHGPLLARDDCGLALRELREALGERLRVAERRAHEQERRVRQREQRDLPRRAALAVRVVVELVEDRRSRRACFLDAAAERHVREDLGRAADDGRVGVHARVARDHAHVFGRELPREREELLVHEGLDRRRVEAALALGHRDEIAAPSVDERLARSGRRIERDDVLAGAMSLRAAPPPARRRATGPSRRRSRGTARGGRRS